MNRRKDYSYEVDKITLEYKCHFAVYPKGGGSSICYCTDKERAAFIVAALEAYKQLGFEYTTKHCGNCGEDLDAGPCPPDCRGPSWNHWTAKPTAPVGGKEGK